MGGRVSHMDLLRKRKQNVFFPVGGVRSGVDGNGRGQVGRVLWREGIQERWVELCGTWSGM